MAKYRKNPVIIEAWQWNGKTLGDARKFQKENGLPNWSIGNAGDFSDGRATGMIIPTLEGRHLAQQGDFIIRGIAGEYYPCKPDIFEKTYEPVGNYNF